jgi:4-amino-4-deoxy-L-arabinose transferase-like glycosyltransferase
MQKKKTIYAILAAVLLASLTIKLIFIFTYGNKLTLDSDDLNYIKSAVYLLKRGVFAFFNYDEPTVFVMPLYPLFLAGVFKVFGFGYEGMQAFRIIQAFAGTLTTLLVFLIGKRLFSAGTGLLAAALNAFYLPDIATCGYALTETIFTTLLCLIVLLSLSFSPTPSTGRFALLGAFWALCTLLRPTIAMYPLLLFTYLFLIHRCPLRKILKTGIAMAATFAIIMSPWWIRNFMEYGSFIPLTASSGNPMLQGTYVDYRQTHENIVYYKPGKTEVETAVKRMREGFRKDFWGYLRWFTIGKTYYFWFTVFYWKEYFGIAKEYVTVFHYILLLGFPGMAVLAAGDIKKYLLPVLIIFYFNAVHCVYMAFDRYAFPVLPLLCVFSAFFIQWAGRQALLHIKVLTEKFRH